MTDAVHRGALSGVIVGRRQKFLFLLTFMRIPEELLCYPIVKKLSIAVPFRLYLNANRNFKYCENTRDLSDSIDHDSPLKPFDRGGGNPGT
jgi:hypothetical protein